MLDKLIELLIQFVDRILPVYVVKEYEKALHFRVGRLRRVSDPGLHWKLPLADDVDHHVIATTTLTLPAQSLTTMDGVSVVVKAHVKYRVSDVRVFGVEVADAIDALSDVTCGIIHDHVRSVSYAEACSQDMSSVFTKPARREAKRWGIEVEKVTVTDFSQMRSIRLFNEQGRATNGGVEIG